MAKLFCSRMGLWVGEFSRRSIVKAAEEMFNSTVSTAE
jgi:hypothetical protein